MFFSESQNVQKAIERDLLLMKKKVLPTIKNRSELGCESKSYENAVIVKVFPYFFKCRSQPGEEIIVHLTESITGFFV